MLKIKVLDEEALYDLLLEHYSNYVENATKDDIKIEYFEENEDGTIECWYNKEYSIPLTNDVIEKVESEE